MTRSLAFHQPTQLRAPQIPTTGCVVDFLMHENGCIRD